MMADNIEHVTSHWMMFQNFRSPALGGFAAVSVVLVVSGSWTRWQACTIHWPARRWFCAGLTAWLLTGTPPVAENRKAA